MHSYISKDTVITELQDKDIAIGRVKPAEYHQWKTDIATQMGMPVVSKSTLADFMANPYLFNYNRLNGIRKESAAMALGSLVDCLCLTPELFGESYRVEEKRVALKKDGTPYANGQQDAAQKAEWAELEEKGIKVISPFEKETADDIAAQATGHLESLDIILGVNAITQLAIWAVLREIDGIALATPIILTGMLDVAACTTNSIVDVKTTSVDVANKNKLFWQIEDYRYGMQAAIYSDLYTLAFGADGVNFAFLFTATAMPTMSRLIVMPDTAIEMYRIEYKTGLRKYAEAVNTKYWGESMLDECEFRPTDHEYRYLQSL